MVRVVVVLREAVVVFVAVAVEVSCDLVVEL